MHLGGVGFIGPRPSSTWASCRVWLGTREGVMPSKDLWLSIQSPRLASGNHIGPAFPRERRAVWLFPAFAPRVFLSAALPCTQEVPAVKATVYLCPDPCCHRPFFFISLITSHSFRSEEGFCSVTLLLEGLRPTKTDGCLAYF